MLFRQLYRTYRTTRVERNNRHVSDRYEDDYLVTDYKRIFTGFKLELEFVAVFTRSPRGRHV